MLGDVLTIGSLTLVKSMMYSPTDELLSAAGHVRMTSPAEADAWSDKAWAIQRDLRTPSSGIQSSDTTEDSWLSGAPDTPRIYDPVNATNLVWKRAGYICFLWPWEWTWIYKLSAARWSSSHKQTKIRPSVVLEHGWHFEPWNRIHGNDCGYCISYLLISTLGTCLSFMWSAADIQPQSCVGRSLKWRSICHRHEACLRLTNEPIVHSFPGTCQKSRKDRILFPEICYTVHCWIIR